MFSLKRFLKLINFEQDLNYYHIPTYDIFVWFENSLMNPLQCNVILTFSVASFSSLARNICCSNRMHKII